MKKYLTSTAICMALMGTGIAYADCDMGAINMNAEGTTPAQQERAMSEEQKQQAGDANADQNASGEAMTAEEKQAENARLMPEMNRDLRLFRNAAERLNMYGQEDACEEIVSAMQEIIDDPEEAMRTSNEMQGENAQTAQNSNQGEQEDNEYAYQQAVPLSEASGGYALNNLVGADLYGSDDEEIGEISDIYVDTQNNQQYAVISYGGFLGLGEESSAVPISLIRSSQDNEVYYLPMTEADLEKAPRFERDSSNEWATNQEWRQQNQDFYKSYQNQ